MNKKYIFLDLDGTIIDHNSNGIPKSTIEAIKKLQENGHEIIISTGRPPALFYDVDKKLNIDSYIASNGRIVVYKNEVIVNQPIDKEVVKDLAKYAKDNKIDLAFESFTHYVLNTHFTNLPAKFSDAYHIHYPEVHENYHLENDIYQIILFYTDSDYGKFEKMFPTLSFHYSNQYGLDINEKGGMKDIGVKAIVDFTNISIEDTIAVGDGFNDVLMIEYVHLGVAMGNAIDKVKEIADFVTLTNDENGVAYAIKTQILK